ncbi:MAG: hypothetical protein HY905_20655 [Deltaproteobacteria bacterium]|nr:hypothetical protein [Deltaproteobacteria bacterium]
MRWMEAMRGERGQRRLTRVAGQAALLVVVPSLIAVAADLVRPDGLPLVADTDYLGDILVPCPENVKEAAAVALVDLPADAGGMTFIDARTRGEYLAGHIRGALSIPHRALHTGDAKFKAALEADLRPLRGVPGGRIVVCGDERIGSGRDFASVLRENGFDGARYLAGGCEAWRADGRPWEAPRAGATAATVLDLSPDLAGLTVVDARFSKNWRRGHIPGAISIPYRMLSGADDEKLAPLRGIPGSSIVVYGAAVRGEGKDLAEILAAAAWPGVRYIDGGLDAWEAAGRPVEGAGEVREEREAGEVRGERDDGGVSPDGAGGAP